MRVLALTVPGRFPTVVHDPGTWWEAVSGTGAHELERHSLNFDWWRLVGSPAFLDLLLQPLPTFARWHTRLTWSSRELNVRRRARDCQAALAALARWESYGSRDAYLGALTPIATFFELANSLQSEFSIDVNFGPRARELDYADSAALVAYSAADTLLGRTIAAITTRLPRHDVFLLTVTSPEDLLTALMVAWYLRTSHPGAHVSLIDHGYENFSLHSFIPRLKDRRTLDSVFDTIVVSKDERDAVVPALLDAVSAGGGPRGYINQSDLAAPRRIGPAARGAAPPPVPTFAPVPILWTRLSRRRCYWSRCAFCTQNAKYDDPGSPSKAEIRARVDGLEAHIAAGYAYVIFSDEAVSPAGLHVLADELIERGTRINWACRCKLEKQHAAGLLAKAARSGCAEILYGIESTSPRVLALMDKWTEGVDESFLTGVLRTMSEYGIGVHVNLLAAFPGDTLADVQRSVEFVAGALKDSRGATFLLNEFALFTDTPIAARPAQYGVQRVASAGDVPAPLEFELSSALAPEAERIRSALPQLRERLSIELGWAALAGQPVLGLACQLYFGSGHGLLFKSDPANPFANPLRANALRRTTVV